MNTTGHLTIDEAAERVRVSRSTFREHVLPHLPTIRIGRRRLVKISDLDAWLAKQATRE